MSQAVCLFSRTILYVETIEYSCRMCTYLDIKRAPAFVRKTLLSTLHSENPTPFFARILKRKPSPASNSFNVASRKVSEKTSKDKHIKQNRIDRCGYCIPPHKRKQRMLVLRTSPKEFPAVVQSMSFDILIAYK